jgi:hypothetical protein
VGVLVRPARFANGRGQAQVAVRLDDETLAWFLDLVGRLTQKSANGHTVELNSREDSNRFWT